MIQITNTITGQTIYMPQSAARILLPMLTAKQMRELTFSRRETSLCLR